MANRAADYCRPRHTTNHDGSLLFGWSKRTLSTASGGAACGAKAQAAPGPTGCLAPTPLPPAGVWASPGGGNLDEDEFVVVRGPGLRPVLGKLLWQPSSRRACDLGSTWGVDLAVTPFDNLHRGPAS
jgi:hypothetical protein